jgi:excisionase family DNA binding protein
VSNLLAHLDAMVRALPPGASVTLPVDWLRSELAVTELQEQPTAGRLSDFTVQEVADELGRAPSTVRTWLGAGELEGYRLNGREWRVSRAAVQAFIARQREGKSEPEPEADPDISNWRVEP